MPLGEREWEAFLEGLLQTLHELRRTDAKADVILLFGRRDALGEIEVPRCQVRYHQVRLG